MQRTLTHILALSALSALPACHKSVQAAGTNPFRLTPRIEVVGTAPDLPAPMKVISWEVGRLLPEDWSTRGTTQVQVLQERKTGGTLMIAPAENTAVQVRGLPRDPVDQVRLRMRGGQCQVKVDFLTRGTSVGTTRAISLDSPKEYTDILLDAPFLQSVDTAPDSMVIHITGARGATHLRRVGLLKAAPSHWLPRPGSIPWVSIRQDQRRATGLLSGTPLRTKFLGVGGARLEFSYGIPAAATGTVAARLEVKLWPEQGKPRTQSYLISAHRGGLAWQSEHLDIPGHLDGQMITATFRLVPQGLAQAALALSRPQLVRVPKRPSILLATVDGLRGDAATTPGGAPLIEQAQRQDRVRMLQSPSTSPRVAAGAIMSGLHPTRNGLLLATDRLQEGTETLASRLSDAGYLTLALVGDPRLGHGSGLLEDFDRVFAPTGGATAEELGAQAVAWLANLPPAPIFLWFHANDPLPPFDPKARFIRRFATQEGKKEFLAPRFRPTWNPDEDDARVIRVRYRAEVSEVEREIARLLARGRLSQSTWAVVGLRGMGHGENNLWWRSDQLTPEVLDVPVLSMGVRCDSLLEKVTGHTTSLGRALLDAARMENLEFPAGHKGAIVSFSGDGSRVALRRGKGMGILCLRETTVGPLPRELHDFRFLGPSTPPPEVLALRTALTEQVKGLGLGALNDCACENCGKNGL